MQPDHDLDDLLAKTVSSINDLKNRVDELERLEHAMAQNHGWVSGAWQKDPLRFGISGFKRENIANTSLAAGTNTLNTTAIPAGEWHVITNISILYVGTVANVTLRVMIQPSAVVLFYQSSISSGQWYDRQGWWPMDVGEYLQLEVLNATLNDDAYIRISGFRIDIDQ